MALVLGFGYGTGSPERGDWSLAMGLGSSLRGCWCPAVGLVSGCGAGCPRHGCWEPVVGQETTQRGCCGLGLGSSHRAGISKDCDPSTEV